MLNAMAEQQLAVYGQIARAAALEAVGLFWLGAELAILFFVLAARRHIQSRPLPQTFVLNNTEKRRVLLWSVGFLLFCGAVLGRHGLYALETIPADVVPLLAARTRVHLAVWSCFVTGWVVLEAAIVYQGARGYQSLKTVLGNAAPAAKPAGRRVAMLCFAAICLLQATSYAQSPMKAAYAANEIYHNAMYLYLRIAGIVWISVEWVAAVILWRAYGLLASAAKRASAND